MGRSLSGIRLNLVFLNFFPFHEYCLIIRENVDSLRKEIVTMENNKLVYEFAHTYIIPETLHLGVDNSSSILFDSFFEIKILRNLLNGDAEKLVVKSQRS